MSRVVEEIRTNGHKKTKKETIKDPKNRFVSFHPTKEEKDYIRGMEEPLDDCVVGLRTWLEQGHKLTVGYSPKNNAFYASLRENCDDWRDARAVSAWHSDPDIAIRSLCYAIVSRYPTFPQLVFDVDEYDLNW